MHQPLDATSDNKMVGAATASVKVALYLYHLGGG